MDNLEDFLKGNEEEVAAVEPVEAEAEAPEAVEAGATEAKPETVERPRGPDGKFIPKGEKEDASPASEEPPLDHAALIGERRRRQEAEARIAEYEARLAQLHQPQQPQVQGPPDRWEDPEGYDQWLISRASEIAQEQATHAVQTQRIYSSAVQARGKYADYGDAHAVFGEMVQSNPSLFQQMVNAPDPAEFAYQTAKTEMEIRQYGGIDKLVQARVQAELTKAQTPAPVTQTPIPDTLADAQSARGSSAAQPFHVPSLDEILGKRG